MFQTLVIFVLRCQVAPEVLQSCVSTLLPILTFVGNIITTHYVEGILNSIDCAIRKGRCHMRHILTGILFGATRRTLL